MPRRNRNARCLPDPDLLAAVTGTLILAPAVASAKYPCAGCHRRGYWDGDRCPACKGRLIRDTGNHAVRRG